MKINKLLFVTKFEDLCYDALNPLLSLMKADLEHVVFLNVIERDKVAMKRGSGYLKEEEVKLKETA
ncbi:MAG: universal stress protein, partial [Desulfobacteraceae bacterium]|nr:universal stress protein [Desulfobacteraceae bacterium]